MKAIALRSASLMCSVALWAGKIQSLSSTDVWAATWAFAMRLGESAASEAAVVLGAEVLVVKRARGDAEIAVKGTGALHAPLTCAVASGGESAASGAVVVLVSGCVAGGDSVLLSILLSLLIGVILVSGCVA